MDFEELGVRHVEDMLHDVAYTRLELYATDEWFLPESIVLEEP